MVSNRMSAVLSVLMTRNLSKMFLRPRRTLEFSHSLGHSLPTLLELTSADVCYALLAPTVALNREDASGPISAYDNGTECILKNTSLAASGGCEPRFLVPTTASSRPPA